MRKALLAVLTVAVACAVAVGVAPAAYAASTGTVKVTVTQDYGTTQDVFKLVNAERKKAHLPKLKLDKSLTKAAIQRAAEVGIYVPWTSPHKRPNGKSSRTVNSKINYECCAEGYPTAKSTVDGWMASPPHRAGILLKSAKSIGIASVTTGDNEAIWVLEFSASKAKKVEKSKKTVTYTKKVKAKSAYLKSKFFAIDPGGAYADPFFNDGRDYTVGNSKKLTVVYSSKYNVTKTGVNPASFKWKSSNPSVATVSKSGMVNAKSVGSTVVTGKLKKGPNVTVKKTINVVDGQSYSDDETYYQAF